MFRGWFAVWNTYSINDYKGPCSGGEPPYHGTIALLGRAEGGFVLAVHASSNRYWFRRISHLVDVVKEGGKDEISYVEFKGLVWAEPMVYLERGEAVVRLVPVRRHVGGFKPRCVPPLGGSRWWAHGHFYEDMQERTGLSYPVGEGQLYVLTERGLEVQCGDCMYELQKIALSPCKYAFSGRWLFLSPVGPPVRAPGAGSLTGAELPVVRHRDRYLRVGQWIAWHRVLGLLDDGRWVLIGDDGLYEAVFRPTVSDPLGVFGEVGFVKVLGPYNGDVDDVSSPCGAPKLVACNEDTRHLLEPLGHKCEAEEGIPHVVLLSNTPVALGREVVDWPLTDTCGPLLRLGDVDLFTWD